MTAGTRYDLIVVGAGPGGYVAAIRAAQLGMKTAIVEREHLGGICLNWGCIPTKALLRSAELLDQMRNAADFGIKTGPVSPDLTTMVGRSRKVSATLNGGVGFLLKKNKVDVIWGEAELTGAGKIRVRKTAKAPVEPVHPAPKNTKGEGDYSADHIILATGARPRVLPGFEPDGDIVLTYFEAMKPTAIPESLLVMGSGAIGMEFASFYRSLGTRVTILEMLPEVLPQEDSEIAALAREAFARRDIRILTGAEATALERVSGKARVTIAESGGATGTETFDAVICAVGVVPNTEGLGLEAVGLTPGKTGIETDGKGRTGCAGVYAIGDLAGAPMLAHKAEHEAVICVEAIAGHAGHALDRTRIPACTYCHPQIASVGLTQAAAEKAGRTLRIGRFPFAANGKAVASGDSAGMVKTIFDAETGELIGAHMIGPEVTELIQGYVTAMSHETTDDHLMQTIQPHPTLSEALHEAVLDAHDRAIHI